jgi:hypothetical protein
VTQSRISIARNTSQFFAQSQVACIKKSVRMQNARVHPVDPEPQDCVGQLKLWDGYSPKGFHLGLLSTRFVLINTPDAFSAFPVSGLRLL